MSSVPPTVLSGIPTLGYAARLGELYDQRSKKFLGVQLYPKDQVNGEEVTTDVRNTDLSLSLSNTHEDKATLLDIDANLSLSVLSGMIKVSGSASYVNDKRSNSTAYAYALALKMRLSEKRILFAEDDLGYNALPFTEEGYITTNLATHFVSAVVYGGNYIVNLIARKSELSEEQNIQGKLQLEFNKLKGEIDLSGEASATIKDQYSHLDDKFDLVIHGDVALPTVPVDPKDVLDTFHSASQFIQDGGGVPISVTLQPIPRKLYIGGLIYILDADVVNDVLRAFSKLDDLSSRFLALQDGANAVQTYVPELAQAIRIVAAKFTEDLDKLRHKLAEFLQDYQQGGGPPPNQEGDNTGQDDNASENSNLTSDEVLKLAIDLYEIYYTLGLLKDPEIPKQYHPSFAALDKCLLQFRSFASDVQKVGQSLQPSSAAALYLSSVESVSEAIGLQSRIPLFVMTSLTVDKPNFAVARYLALLRKYPDYINDSDNPAYFVYAENLDKLDQALAPPGGDEIFSKLKNPSVFVGIVEDDGELTWASAPTRGPDVTFPFWAYLSNGSLNSMTLNIDTSSLDIKNSFSVRLLATSSSTPTTPIPFFYLYGADTGVPILVFRDGPFSALVGSGSDAVELGVSKNQNCPLNKQAVVTFVQDTQAKKWILYLDDEEIDSASFDEDVFGEIGWAYIAFWGGDKWWDGVVHYPTVYPRALSKEELRAKSASFVTAQGAKDIRLLARIKRARVARSS